MSWNGEERRGENTVESRLASIETKLDIYLKKHEEAIFGDGNGKKGLLLRVSKMEWKWHLAWLGAVAFLKVAWDWILRK